MENIKIGVSYLTAKTLNLINYKTDAFSYQAYLMLGEKCQNNCSFCAQAKESQTEKVFLSRVKWPLFNIDQVEIALKKAILEKKIKKICFQVVSFNGYFEVFKNVLNRFVEKFNVPIGASIHISRKEEAEELFYIGLSKLGFAIDCVSNSNYKYIKGRDFCDDLKLFYEIGSIFNNKITTHIICGLGETDFEILNFYIFSKILDTGFALFNFTPIKKTKFENKKSVPLERYRKIQLTLAIIDEILKKENFLSIKKGFNKEDLILIKDKNSKFILNNLFSLIKFLDFFYFEKYGNLIGFKKNSYFRDKYELFDFLNKVDSIRNGQFLMTRGCEFCNRPYYNEKPQEHIYNYFKLPEKEKVKESIITYVNSCIIE
ncbi:MAG: hypothetical protein N3A58_06985 [Spirochaetes bacterium]|nr:hypothetical protein [Spirochaetota bacterium]